MNRVVLITTDGCAGCDIMMKIVMDAYSEAKAEDTSIGIYDFQDREVENLIENNNIKDFPTTLFITKNKVVDKILGTCTKKEVISKIRNNFVENE